VVKRDSTHIICYLFWLIATIYKNMFILVYTNDKVHMHDM